MLPSGEYSKDFVDGMADRMGVSYAKYGPIRDAYPHKVNAIDSLYKRLDRYNTTGNTEWLMDVANFAMIEFMYPAHPRAHFRATDSNESPGRSTRDDAAHPAADNASLSDQPWKDLQEFVKSQDREV